MYSPHKEKIILAQLVIIDLEKVNHALQIQKWEMAEMVQFTQEVCIGYFQVEIISRAFQVCQNLFSLGS